MKPNPFKAGDRARIRGTSEVVIIDYPVGDFVVMNPDYSYGPLHAELLIRLVKKKNKRKAREFTINRFEKDRFSYEYVLSQKGHTHDMGIIEMILVREVL